MRPVPVLLTALMIATARSADEGPPVPAPAEETALEPAKDLCAIGGFTIGDPEPPKDRRLSGGKRPFLKVKGEVYRVPTTGEFRQYVVIRFGKIDAIIREYQADSGSRVAAALNEKYGSPVAGDMVPQVKSTYALFGGNVTLESRSVWQDETCGMTAELVNQDRTTITAFGGGSSDHVAVIWTRPPPSSPLVD